MGWNWGAGVGIVILLEGLFVQQDVFVDLCCDTASDSLDDLGLLGLLSVNLDVEGDEQDQVRGDDRTARQGGQSSSRAGQVGGILGVVVVHDLDVDGKVDEAQVDEKLDDLEAGDPLLPPDTDASGGEEVVPVHDDVDKQVEGDGDPRDRGGADQLGVAEERRSTVVVGVQEGQLLLLQDKEDGVNELDVLGQVVHVVEHDHLLCPRVLVADGVEEPVVVDLRNKLLDEREEQDQRQSRQKKVVHLEDPVENKRRHVQLLHQSVSAKDHRVVHGDGAKDFLRRRQKRLAGHKLKLRHHEAALREHRKEPFHVGVEIDPERVVDAWNRERGHVSVWIGAIGWEKRALWGSQL